SASTRIASSTIRVMSSGSRMFRDGRISAPRVGAGLVAISVPSGRASGRWPFGGGRSCGRWSGMGFLLPLVSRLMHPVVPSGGTAEVLRASLQEALAVPAFVERQEQVGGRGVDLQARS